MWRPGEGALPTIDDSEGRSLTAGDSEVRRDGLQGVFGCAVDVDVLEGDKQGEEEERRLLRTAALSRFKMRS